VQRDVVGASVVVVTVVVGGRVVVVVVVEVVGRVEVVVAGRVVVVVVEVVVVDSVSSSGADPGGTPSSAAISASMSGNGRAMAVTELIATTATTDTNSAYSTMVDPRSWWRRRAAWACAVVGDSGDSDVILPLPAALGVY
jgi:hypothetical protein